MTFSPANDLFRKLPFCKSPCLGETVDSPEPFVRVSMPVTTPIAKRLQLRRSRYACGTRLPDASNTIDRSDTRVSLSRSLTGPNSPPIDSALKSRKKLNSFPRQINGFRTHPV